MNNNRSRIRIGILVALTFLIVMGIVSFVKGVEPKIEAFVLIVFICSLTSISTIVIMDYLKYGDQQEEQR